MSILTRLLINDAYKPQNANKPQPTVSYEQKRESQKKAWQDAFASTQSQTQTSASSSGSTSSGTEAGSNISTLNDAANDTINNSGNGSGDGSDGSSDGTDGEDSGGGAVSPLLQGEMSFEELIGEICNGIDLIFATKRSTVVITDYEGIYAEAKYLRDLHHESVKGEDVNFWQLQDGTYELDVSEYGFYNTVKVRYNKGTVVESYEDLARVYGEVAIEYDEPKLDKSTAIMKAKAYLAAHVRDFEMSVKATILHDGDIDIGDIVTIDNPLTMRDETRALEKRDPEYFFVMGKSISWEGEGFITCDLELRYGAASPEKLDVPETGAGYSGGGSSDSSSSASGGDIDKAIDEVGKKWHGMGYSGECQTYSCVQSAHRGDCWGCSDTIACELINRGVTTRILQYGTEYSDVHRSVQYKDSSGNWQDFPYRKYGFNTLFNNTSGTAGGSEVKCTCG